MNSFTLKPFPSANSLPAMLVPSGFDNEINGTIDRQDGMLSIEYRLSGDLTALEIAPLATVPTRKDQLWETTCFEFFLGIPGGRNYWEFNLSPSGDWNIFHLDDYRQGLREELVFTSLPLKIDRQPNLLSLGLELDLSKIIAVERSIEISIATVIKPRHGEISYWALTHCGAVADFHLRNSFMIRA
jgi:hypothetical protein